MRHVRYGLLKQAIAHLNINPVLNIINRLSLNSEEKRLLYNDAWEHKKFDIMEQLFQEYIIQADFHFMHDLAQALAQAHRYQHLPCPNFSVDKEDFKSIVDRLTRGQATPGRIKKFGELTQTYGVVFLNNVHALNVIYPKDEINYDRVVNLNHDQILLPKVYLNFTEACTVIRKNYSLERLFNLLTHTRGGLVSDVASMLEGLVDPLQISNQLIKKPRTFTELHDNITDITMAQKKVNYELHQEVDYLHGVLLLDYQIEVPKESLDLVGTSRELKHCVHGYDKAVIQKEVQIINLIRDHKRCYTIELIPDGSTFNVRQFKGRHNDPTMEGPPGAPYVNELKKLFRSRIKE